MRLRIGTANSSLRRTPPPRRPASGSVQRGKVSAVVRVLIGTARAPGVLVDGVKGGGERQLAQHVERRRARPARKPGAHAARAPEGVEQEH